MTPLIQFLLTQIGLPVVSLIVKDWKASHNNNWPTPEEVAQAFLDDITKWNTQGEAWLAANPKT